MLVAQRGFEPVEHLLTALDGSVGAYVILALLCGCEGHADCQSRAILMIFKAHRGIELLYWGASLAAMGAVYDALLWN